VGELFVDIEEIGGFTAKTATVVDDLAVYLPGRIVDQRHIGSPGRGREGINP
jgi:hypothetical protein